MTSAPVRDRYHAPIPVRAALALILGPSQLHLELCEVGCG